MFNLLGPLANPAGASVQVIGVPALALVEKLGHALAELGGSRALVVHGMDGLDEISLSAETEVADVRPGKVKRYRMAPEDFGVARASRESLAGGDAAVNAGIIRGILAGRAGTASRFRLHQCGGGAGCRGACRRFSRRHAAGLGGDRFRRGAGQAGGADRVWGIAMKDQYFGDLNDYRKYGLLRILADGGAIKIGVCWMLTDSDGTGHGKFIEYVAQSARWRAYDPPLFDAYTDAGSSKSSPCNEAENLNLIPSAIYFNELLQPMLDECSRYFMKMLDDFDQTDIVLFDPTQRF